ncbi:MAG: DEAD/DEAH box helicase family protein [Treponema sp.]|nr:DEAD/DEAH box helicase family protein [Treponema sp.]
MQLKNYQQNSLDTLKRFFEYCRIMGHTEAFKKITGESEIASRLVNVRNGYTTWDAIPNTPRVCIKIPTGGGKTILAAHSIKVISQVWCGKDYPLALWFVPSDTIRRQTIEALKNPRHPYRQVLDDQFAGKVRIFDLDEKCNIRPMDISANACIIVSTIQSFVKEDTSKYNVYKDNENYEDHFAKIPTACFSVMEASPDYDRPKYSFANLLLYHRPIMIVDEAHKVVTDLSQETQRRINPATIVEFTATPRPNNNTIYNVRAAELKEEEMIKLPIALVEHSGWELAVDEAIARRAALEKDAQKEREYIRPILLFQAQSKDKEVTVDVLKNYLLETANLPENQIKIATGEQKQLDDIDLFNPDEPTRFIITVEALKEGWDCSFAYVLCSLANIKSDTSVEQLLGRVMRMPYAKERKEPSLNKAYAYVVSPHFGEAAKALTEKLINKGFDDDEAQASIQQEPPAEFTLNPNWGTSPNQFKLSGHIDKNALPSSIELDKNNTLFFTLETTESDIEKVCQKISSREAADLIWKFRNYKSTPIEQSPASKGEKFSIPRLLFEAQGEFLFADTETIFEQFDWNIKDYASCELSSIEFNIEETPGKGFFIDIDGNRLRYSETGKDQLLPYMTDVDVWTEANLVHWLDNSLKQNDIPQSHMVFWLGSIIRYLTEKRKISVTKLMIAKYALLNKLSVKIAEGRKKARTTSFELFEKDGRKIIDFETPLNFYAGMYDGVPLYQGKYKFKKHFLGNDKIPMFDGGENGEECSCAKAIDSESETAYWLRNVSRHPASFHLPTSTDNFYPDFIVKLKDERILIIEYKGAHLATIDDTKEKALIGELWEKHTKGKGLFLITLENKNGKNAAEQIKEKICHSYK